jgi:hypothetical protein
MNLCPDPARQIIEESPAPEGDEGSDPAAPPQTRQLTIVQLSCLAVAGRPEEAAGWLPVGLATDEALEALLAGVTTLVLGAAYMTSWELRRICRILMTRPRAGSQLRTVLLCNTRVGGDGMSCLSQLIQSGACPLATLGLGNNRAGNDFRCRGLRRLGRALETPHCVLERLYLEDDDTFGDAGVAALMPCIQMNRSLRQLVLRNVNITSASVRYLANTILIARNLRVLNLNENSLDYAGVEKLLKSVWDHLEPRQQEALQVNLSIQDQEPPLW